MLGHTDCALFFMYMAIIFRLDSKTTATLQSLQGSPCVVILPCKYPVKITGYHSNPSSYVAGTQKNCNQYREIPVSLKF